MSTRNILLKAAKLAVGNESLGYAACIVAAAGAERREHIDALRAYQDLFDFVGWESAKERSLSLLLAAETLG